MADLPQVKAWIAQAKADFEAAKAGPMTECYQRYWYQQSYEKTIKAYALMRWSGKDRSEEEQFAKLFLLQHSPLKTIAKSAGSLKHSLFVLQRDVEGFVNEQFDADALRKIDEATPRNDPEVVSYRYPLLVDGNDVAPKDYDDWSQHQGSVEKVKSAISKLIKRVEEELKLQRRQPK